MQYQERVRLWLARRRGGDDGEGVTLVYTTPDGGYVLHKDRTANTEAARTPTATVEVEPARLTPVDDPDERVVLATGARETRKRYGPDDPI